MESFNDSPEVDNSWRRMIEKWAGLNMQNAQAVWEFVGSPEFRLYFYFYSYFHEPEAAVQEFFATPPKDRKKKMRELQKRELEYARDSFPVSRSGDSHSSSVHRNQ